MYSDLYIRVDMNSRIATGHLMRCLSIADAAQLMGVRTTFIVADNNPIALLENRGYEYIVLNTRWDELDSETAIMRNLIREKNIDLLLIDSYYVTHKYMSELYKVTRTVYIDDMGEELYPIHSLICYANYWKKLGYENRYRDAFDNGLIEKMPQLLLGCDYVPLRHEFAGLPPRQIKEIPDNLLIMSGGSDPYNIIGKILSEIKIDNYRNINVICGKYNKNVSELKRLYSDYNQVNFLQNITNMIDYMKEADISISAGGTTLYELCAVGTPTITYSFVDNQIMNVEQFCDDEIMLYAGDVRSADVSKFIQLFLEKLQDVYIREHVSMQMQSLVKGNGAENICKNILLE